MCSGWRTGWPLALLILLTTRGAFAQQTPPQPFTNEPVELVNFAFSAVLGTGYYSVGERDVYVVRAPLSWTLREASTGHDGSGDQFGVRLLLPITFGLYDFALRLPELDAPDIDDVGTVSFLPGIELDIPRASGWRLRPFAQLGGGFETQSGESSTLYATGLKMRYELRPLSSDSVGITWGQGLVVAGYNPSQGPSSSLGYVSFGVDARFPQRWRMFDRSTFVGVLAYANLYFDEAEFINLFRQPETVRREFTLGLSIGGAPSFSVMKIPFERLGVGVKFGPGIRALTLFAGFPF